MNVFAFRCVLALHLGRVLVHHKLGRVVLGEARSWAGTVIGDVNQFLALFFSPPFGSVFALLPLINTVMINNVLTFLKARHPYLVLVPTASSYK